MRFASYTQIHTQTAEECVYDIIDCDCVCVCSCIVHWASYNKTQVEHSVFQIIANWLYSSFCSFVCLYIDFVNGTYNKCWIMYIFVVYDVSTFCIYINSTLPATQVYLPNARCISDYELCECVVWCGVRLFECVCLLEYVFAVFVHLCLFACYTMCLARRCHSLLPRIHWNTKSLSALCMLYQSMYYKFHFCVHLRHTQ